jgi:hypothetical protein
MSSLGGWGGANPMALLRTAIPTRDLLVLMCECVSVCLSVCLSVCIHSLFIL